MSPRNLRPSHFTVRRIIGEEAMKACVSADAVINIDRSARFVAFQAMRRIASETGCTPIAIAEVWGCGDGVVWKALNDVPEAPKPRPSATYDARTVERLCWAHGEARAAQIITGQDPRTRADIGRWNALGTQRGNAA